MKKYFYSVLAASMLFACSQEEIVDVTKGEGQKVTFKVEIPEIGQSRTVGGSELGDGSKADKLIYAMYEENTNVVLVSGCVEEKSERTFEVTVPMAKDIKYAFVGNALAQEVGQVHNVTLKRPFAQLNAATTKQDLEDAKTLMSTIASSRITVSGIHDTYNVFNGATSLSEGTTNFQVTYSSTNESPKMLECNNPQVKYEDGTNITNEPIEVNGTTYYYLNMAYVLPGNTNASVKYEFYRNDSKLVSELDIENVPLQANYRTNIVGNLLTKSEDYTITIDAGFGGNYTESDGIKTESITVMSAEEFNTAFANNENDIIVLGKDINLNETDSRAAYIGFTLANGRTLTIDLNGKTLSSVTSSDSDNKEMFLVKGNLTVKNGTITTEHTGTNMGWNSMTTIFDVTAGGVLNLEGVTAKNLGGSDMGFVAHLNNWGEVTLNVENCTLESNYVPVRVFNSGNDMNNVTIKNSTLKGGSAAFWVHNYTVGDFGTPAKAEAQKVLLNLNIYNQGNTFTPDLNGIRYGFTNEVRADAYGITKSVSEDGTVVTLGSVIEDGLVRRGVAGAEENTTIKKAIVGEGITTLYDRTFRRFYALETVKLPSTLTTIGAAGSGVFQSCTALKNIVIPESVTVLGKGTFQECSSLESINIPSGVTRIESDALRATGLKSVEFHAGVTYFGEMAFRDCKQLTEVVINAPMFEMEDNTFGIMAAPFTPMTIHVANAGMKAYVESKLTAHAKTYITVVAPEVVANTTDLRDALAEGKNVVLDRDLTISNDEGITAPYGNKTALSQNGGVFDGNGKTITSNILGDSYIYMTNGGTTKNLNITGAFRGVMIMSPTQTVYLENVVSGGKGVVYAFNTGEGNSTQDVVATNCTFNGWSSWSEIKSATFTNCTFGQGSEYSNVTGRIARPYVNSLFEGCEFCSKFYIDLSALKADQKVTLKNCTVNGVKITAENWTSLVAPEDTCGEGQISVELKNGTYLTADNLADYIVFE